MNTYRIYDQYGNAYWRKAKNVARVIMQFQIKMKRRIQDVILVQNNNFYKLDLSEYRSILWR